MKSEIYSEVPKSRRSSLHDVIRANSNKNFKKQIFFIWVKKTKIMMTNADIEVSYIGSDKNNYKTLDNISKIDKKSKNHNGMEIKKM